MAVFNSIIVGRATRKGGATILARITDTLGSLITQASVVSIAFTIQDITAGAAASPPITGALTVANVLYNSLQVSNGWNQDSPAIPGPDGLWGWNFRYVVPAADLAFTVSNDQLGNPQPHTFEVDVVFVPIVGENFILQAVFPVNADFV